MSLTSAGSAFLQDAKAILERMSRAQERVHDAATGLTGTLRVGYVLSLIHISKLGREPVLLIGSAVFLSHRWLPELHQPMESGMYSPDSIIGTYQLS